MADPATVPAAASGVPRLRAVLDDVPSYVPGRPPQAADGVTPYKLASNENPYPPLPSVLDVVARAAADANRYPDMLATGLTAAIGAHDGVPQEHVVAGPGSVGVLSQVLTAAAGDGDEVVHAWRSFEAYPIVVRLSGATPVPVPLTADGRHDMPALAAAVTERTRLVVVCSPNNPTGPVVTAAEMDELLAAVPSDVLVVLDEAYRAFVRPGAGAPDAVALHLAHPNLVVLRTFSKAYGLAALRVGYAIGASSVLDAARSTAIPLAVTAQGQAAALASLAHEEELLARVDRIAVLRDQVWRSLVDQGWEPPLAQGNFVWLPTGEHTAHAAEVFEAHGLVVRAFAPEGVRITIGEPESVERLLRAAREVLGNTSA